MTSTARQPVCLMTCTEPTQHPESLPHLESSQPQGVTLCWDLATRAGKGLATNGHANHAASHAVALELSIEPTAGTHHATVRLRAILRSGDRADLRILVGAHTRWLCESGFNHVDIDGVVSCTFHASSPARPVYARCPLLTALGIPAGSYSLRSIPKEVHIHKLP